MSAKSMTQNDFYVAVLGHIVALSKLDHEVEGRLREIQMEMIGRYTMKAGARSLGRLVSNVHTNLVEVDGDPARFYPGQVLQLCPDMKAPRMRAGTVQVVCCTKNVLELDSVVNVGIPAACTGDHFYEKF